MILLQGCQAPSSYYTIRQFSIANQIWIIDNPVIITGASSTWRYLEMKEQENGDKCCNVPSPGPELLEKTGEILGYGEICDHCLGRFFGKRSFGITNEARGRGLRVALALHMNVPLYRAGRTTAGSAITSSGVLVNGQRGLLRPFQVLNFQLSLLVQESRPSLQRARRWSGVISPWLIPNP